MSKHYQTPRLSEAMTLCESTRRELLASILLSAQNTDDWLYRRGCETLFHTERACIRQNCRLVQSGEVRAIPYRADLYSLSTDLLTAAVTVLRQREVSLAVSITGTPVKAAVFPRFLQFAIVSLLRIALQHGNCRYASAGLTVTPSQFLLSVCVDRIPKQSADLNLCADIAALHGGRLLCTDRSASLQFPPKTEISADPGWHSPGVDGLIKDPLSSICLGL